MTPKMPTSHPRSKRSIRPWVYDLLLVYALLAGAFFRFSGILWGEYQYLHPDERFLVWVGTDIQPVESLSEYFNTAISPLNPHNVRHTFYVYGTLPMFITRYVVEWAFGHSGFNEMTQVGRLLSSLADLLTVFLVYLVAERLYDRRVAWLSAAFSAAVVLQIQQSHFFTMDTFINAFSFLAFYFAVRVMTNQRAWESEPAPPDDSGVVAGKARRASFWRHPLLLPSLGFGIALGMAVSSKINAAPMAATLPLAMLVGLLRLPSAQRPRRAMQALIYLVLAAVVSLLVFRICQPYAFSGPGFFGIKPNPAWIDNIKSLMAQSNGDVDFPPAMQWARRPVWFSFQNLVTWGLGLPLGILAWAGFLWAGWRMLNGWRLRRAGWQNHILLWTWTAAYFAWQSSARNPTMRYQLPIYPTLVIFAAWAIVALYDYQRKRHAGEAQTPTGGRFSQVNWPRVAAILAGAAIMLATYAYAFAFSRIYVRPITRVAATRWIYQNIPGPVNLPIQTDQGDFNQILPLPYNLRIAPGSPYSFTFQPKAAGTLSQVILPRLLDEQGDHQVRTLNLSISTVPKLDEPLASASLVGDLSPQDNPRGQSFTLTLDHPLQLVPEQTYNLRLEMPGESVEASLVGPVSLRFLPSVLGDSLGHVELPLKLTLSLVSPTAPYSNSFTAPVDGYLTHVLLQNVTASPDAQVLEGMKLTLQYTDDRQEPMQSGARIAPMPEQDAYLLTLNTPLQIFEGQQYDLVLKMQSQGGLLKISGLGVANEGDWDDGLPLRMDGYDGFGGIYPLELNFNMYWDDNPEKLARFERILDQADYLLITSSRQWGSLPRIPERFPMTTIYYRNLLGCPPTQTIEYCYNVAQPGTYQGNLGYELVKVFESSPSIGLLRINDQFAEEAFTVYDHPKVFIFKKTEAYTKLQVQNILGTADFSQIVRMPPMRYPSHPSNLMLPDYQLAEQRQGGTWSELFNPNAWHNRFQPLGVLLWYLSVSLLGLVAYPILRLALPGLEDGGYPLARTAGMLILSYLVWLAGSARLPFSRLTITIALVLMILLSAYLAYRQRHALRQEWRTRRDYFILIEALALLFFLSFLLVRLGNPDLWHPWKGGEKPMDFSYFNAVLKSTSFPPYDPWYAGGYLNYYYYGFVFVGVLVKWLGIVPSFAYNLILPTLFSLIALGAFSVAWNLWARVKNRASDNDRPPLTFKGILSNLQAGNLFHTPLLPALAAAIGTAALGNLGTVRMLFQGYQKIVAPGGVIEGARVLTRWLWAAQGFVKVLQGANMPYGVGDWYWIPSRAIPAPGEVEPITEFPYFTTLYADPHAHLFALPITLLALACITAILLNKGRWNSLVGAVAGFSLTGLAIGALRPTNTWDFYPYLALGLVVLGYVWLAYPDRKRIDRIRAWLAGAPPEQIASEANPPVIAHVLLALGGMLLLAGLSFVLFQPYSQWYALGYSKIDLWKGTHTTISAYLTHWGLFLFIIVTWMFIESVDWMAKTPLSSLHKLRRFYNWVIVALGLLLATIALLVLLKVHIAWLALPLAAWAGVLLLRPGQPDAKRLVLFMIGTGLTLTLMVEVIVLRGDIGRMNTVFKFYLQVWTLFAVSSGAALGWLWPHLAAWLPSWRRTWQVALALFVAGALLYTLMATLAKIDDRMVREAPHTLDGMAFMPYATYTDEWGAMQLGEDYQAIRWMQDHITGSPVIVEANLRNLYRWGSRFTIYTGLPGIVGWEWHQQQQRAVNPGSWVSQRIREIDEFYETTSLITATDFLRKYAVRYIIVGQQERGHYRGPGLEKFAAADGVLWRKVFGNGSTEIYEVIRKGDPIGSSINDPVVSLANKGDQP
ncbi:MAG: DUF2298 domain-containing protein [Chloroflexota bacterium]